MAATLIEAEETSISSETNHIAGLEAQILNSQESLVRLNRELDSALLRITTLENVCSENQTDLHDKRQRIQQLDGEITEREEINERLTQELRDKDEQIENLSELILQLKEHIKQKNEEYTEMSNPELRVQNQFDQHLRELIVADHEFEFHSPEDLLEQYQQYQREKFRDLLQESLITEDLSQLIDSEDILFELFTQLNSLNRLKETLSRDSQQLQHIRSFLHLSHEHEEQTLHELVDQHQCLEYLRNKINRHDSSSNFELIKYVLHDYFDYQQLKEYFHVNDNQQDEINYSKISIERCERAKHIEEFIQSLGLQIDDDKYSERKQLDFIRSTIDFHRNLREKFSIIDTDQNILQLIELIVNTLQSPDNDWTTEQFMEKIQTMKNVEDRENQFDEKQLPDAIKQLVDEHENIIMSSGSDLIRLRELLQSLIDFRRNIFQKSQMNTEEDIYQFFDQSHEKQDEEIQTMENRDLSIRIQELLGIEDESDEEIINQIQEILNTSRMQVDQDQQLRNLHIEKENLVETITKLNENYQQLSDEHHELRQKEHLLDQSLNRLMNQIGVSSDKIFLSTTSDSSSRTRIDELCNLFEYSQLTSTNKNLIEILQEFPLLYNEHHQLKTLINQIDSSDDLDTLSKLQIHLNKVNNLCQLIGNDSISLDEASTIYQTFTDAMQKNVDWKEKLLKRLSIDHDEQIFDRLDELQRTNVLDQTAKILEYEDTLEKLRSQRERMLTKLKDMKTNNESLTTQLKESQQTIDEYHREKINLENHLDELEQQLRRANNQIQMNTDDYQTQLDLQETMKLEIESLKHEIDKQKKLFDSRCRTILNEKKQLEKNLQESLDEKQVLEENNQQSQALLQTIKDSLENVDDIYLIVDGILQLQQDLLILQQRNEQLQIENSNLLTNINQQEILIKESMLMKNDFEKRLLDSEQQLIHSKKQIDEHFNQYERLQREYQIYKEDHTMKINEQVAILNIEQTSPPVEQIPETRNWTAIEMKDEEMPLPIVNKHSTMDTPTALLNLLGELKSKLGITLTHRPRSSSVFFLYLCAVHLLTFYFLFIRRC